jgi:hypothetical protein
MSTAESWFARGQLLTNAAQRRYGREVLRFVRSVVEDAGGIWTPEIAEVAGAKIMATLDEPPVFGVIQYHASATAFRWGDGSKDADFGRLVRRVLDSIGPLLPNTVTTQAVGLILNVADAGKLGLSPSVAANIRARASEDGPDHLAGLG